MSRFQRPLATMARSFSTSSAKNNKVAVMGASGGKQKNSSNPNCQLYTFTMPRFHFTSFYLVLKEFGKFQELVNLSLCC